MSIHSWLKVVQLICDSWRNGQREAWAWRRGAVTGGSGGEVTGGSGGEGWGREYIVTELSNVEG